MSNLVADIMGISSAQEQAEKAEKAELAKLGLARLSTMEQLYALAATKGGHYEFKQVTVVPGVTLGGLTLPLKTIDGATPAAPATLPLETVDVPTANYLEVVEDQAIKQQKALAGEIKSSGFVSEQQGQEMATSAAEKPADMTWVIIVGVLGLILFRRKLWR